MTEPLWQQFGAAIDTLENAMAASPDELWDDQSINPPFRYRVFHTLFYPQPLLIRVSRGIHSVGAVYNRRIGTGRANAERPYTKGERRTHLEHGRIRCLAANNAWTEEMLPERCRFE